jgi:hypothetical protein
VDRVPWGDKIIKHLIYHIWPVKSFGTWQWNLDRLLKSIGQFNGRRIMAIATSEETDSADAVMDYLKGHDFEFLSFRNDKRKRETISFGRMLEQVQSLDLKEVVFCGHAKGVRHKRVLENDGSTVIRWAEAMYETVYENWEGAKIILEHKAMAGSFKRYGQFTTPGNWRWHYSGTFYWFRSCHVFNRNWRKVDNRFFGTESWPGLLFRPEDTGCLFFDGAGDIYKLD